MINRRNFTHLATTGTLMAALPSHAVSGGGSSEITISSPPIAAATLLTSALNTPSFKRDYGHVNVKINSDLGQLRADIANGSSQLAMVPSYTAAHLHNQGHDVGLLNILTFGLLYIVGTDEGVDSLAGLSGKTLAVPFPNDMPDLVLQALLRKAGVAIDSIDIAYTATPPEALQRLLQGKADFALLPEPAASIAHIKAKAADKSVYRNFSLQQLWGEHIGTQARIPQAGLLATRTFFTQQAPLLDALHTALDEALELCRSHPQQAAASAEGIVDVPTAALAAALPHANLTHTPALSVSDEIIDFYRELSAINPDIIGGSIPDKSLFWR